MNRERFEELVAEVVENLPEEFGERMENIVVVVEDAPTQAQLRRSGLGKNMTLLGLYEGVPLTHRTSNYGLVAPDKITIFQKIIEESSRSRDEMDIKVQIRDTVLHEIAHHFGIGDDRLREIEKEKRKKQIPRNKIQ
jgi:predicted Zn-dependent protease with MMP-like domain